MTYVFLTSTLARATGGPLYVRNKKRYLESLGWNVIAIASPHIWGVPIVLDDLKVFQKNLFKELQYSPLLFSKRQIEKIIKRILLLIPSDNVYVVESNKIVLAEWGELLSKKLKAQHIIFNINENNVINEKKVYEF